MAQQELLIRFVRAAENAKVDYMLTGSIVSSMQGEPRSTHDIDVVVLLPEDAVSHLVRSFPWPSYYFDETTVRDALRQNSVCSILDRKSGDKVDLWMLTSDPFDQSRFHRRQQEEIFGVRAFVSSPEDTILQKLRWSELSGGSERQFRDATSVYELQFVKLDTHYMDEWARRLSIENLWQRLRNEAHPLE